jgi:plastocyanin
MTILFGLILAACGGKSTESPGGGPIQVTAQNIRFNPDTLTVKAGQAVTVDITNKDSVPHTFEIEGVEGAGIGVPPGGEGTVEFTIDQPGTYTIFCGVENHRAQGMVGRLIVQP